ncbi:unnamed protein product [Lactuca saligna]|uniref:Uncharacterized protein n=1 Tax=Lactuca saligna TaxID=75948 RepID=A0AA36E6C6_LACSI|nr:unnamed protein product [Lactuca saligna]
MEKKKRYNLVNGVILDKKWKQELKHYMEEIQCSMVVMKGSEPKGRRLNLGQSDNHQIPFFSKVSSPGLIKSQNKIPNNLNNPHTPMHSCGDGIIPLSLVLDSYSKHCDQGTYNFGIRVVSLDSSFVAKGELWAVYTRMLKDGLNTKDKFYKETQEIQLSKFNETCNWSLMAKMMGKKTIEAARLLFHKPRILDRLITEGVLVILLQSIFHTSRTLPGCIGINIKPRDNHKVFIDQEGMYLKAW